MNILVNLVPFLTYLRLKLAKLFLPTNLSISVSDNNLLLLVTENMATSNKERQKQFRESKIQSGQARVSCWLDEDDNQRLQRLMDSLECNGKKQSGYATVISEALKELEISLTPPPQREIVRYGLRNMNNRNT